MTENPELGGRAPAHLSLGAAGELLVASRIALLGYQVYRPLADDRGVYLVVDVGLGRHVMVQVKSVRPPSYVYMKKSTFALESWVALAVVVFNNDTDDCPDVFLLSATEWTNPIPPLVDRTYEGRKSPPEYGVNIRKNWKDELAKWRASAAHVEAILSSAHGR
jgi:hypothetical protein